MSVLRGLGFGRSAAGRADQGILDAIEDRLSRIDARRASVIAAFAALLARVAYADDEISPLEIDGIAAVLREHTGLDGEEAGAVVEIARQKTILLAGAEDHLLTRRLNDVANHDEKREFVDCLYALATADDLVTHLEDREIRSIAGTLMLSHRETLEIRSRYREKLEELRVLRGLRTD